jgi:hypothetical protein
VSHVQGRDNAQSKGSPPFEEEAAVSPSSDSGY